MSSNEITQINPGQRPLIPEDELRRIQLEHDFAFSLEGHQLVDLSDIEKPDGVVGAIREVPANDMATGKTLNCRMFEIDVVDPFVATDPTGYGIVSKHIAGMEDRMRRDGKLGVTEVAGRQIPFVKDRKEATDEKDHGEYTKAWLAGKNLAALAIWRDLVPTAEALGYLGRPTTDAIISNRNGQSAIASPETVAHHRFVDDAVGIRGRATAFRQLGIEHLGAYEAGSTVRWLSLASGTAEPSILAAKHAGEHSGVGVDLVVADIDGKSLSYVSKNAAKHQFDGNVTTIKTNILAENIRKVLEDVTETQEQFDVVEAMGFEEYLPQQGDELALFQEGVNAYSDIEEKKKPSVRDYLPQASEFTKRAWDMVKPGGVLMSGNMILDRPQFGFVFGIVDWPVINARSEESILRVYQEAGILDDDNATVEMFRVRDKNSGTHVYNIVRVTKNPEATEIPEGLESARVAQSGEDQSRLAA